VSAADGGKQVADDGPALRTFFTESKSSTVYTLAAA